MERNEIKRNEMIWNEMKQDKKWNGNEIKWNANHFPLLTAHKLKCQVAVCKWNS